MTCGNHNKELSLNSYQDFTDTTIKYTPEDALEYLHLAVSEEVGELNGKRAKSIRKGEQVNREAMGLELGDILWDVARLADEYNYTLQEIAYMNIDKLTGRAERGTIVGSGDYR